MSKSVHILAVVSVVFAALYGASVVMSDKQDELADQYTKASLRLQIQYAESVKSPDIQLVYVYDNVGYFKDADVIIHNEIRVKTKNGKYAVLGEAAQEVLDMQSYKEFSGGAHLVQDDIGYYI